jgi:hypothetical protein
MRKREIAIILVVFVATNVLSAAFQPQTTLNDGKGWDGVIYYSITEALVQRQTPSDGSSRLYRVGVPLLVAFFSPNDLLLGFKIVNILANAMAVILLAYWLQLYLRDWRIRTGLVIAFITQFHGWTRAVYYAPIHVDPWTFMLLLSGLIGIYHYKKDPSPIKLIFLIIVSVVGVLVREITLIIPLSLLFVDNPLSDSNLREILVKVNLKRAASLLKLSLLPLLVAIITFGVIRLFVTNDYSYGDHAFHWAYEKPFLTYIHAWFIAYGPIVVMLACNPKRNVRFLASNQYILAFLLGFVLLGLFGGGDTERHLYLGMAAVYLLIGRSFEDYKDSLSLPFILVLITSQAISQRLLWIIPDYPNNCTTSKPILTILSNCFNPLDLWSFRGDRSIEALSLLQYLILSALLLWWLARLRSSPQEKHDQQV